ncbi:MAG TPA: DUF5671 domain-containing protein [Candidatus Paceibacterota bacterium]
MQPQTKSRAKDFFLHLGTMVALYVGTVALLNLLFRVINVAFPQINQYGYFGPPISLPVATLIVVFPLFLFLSHVLRRGEVEDPERKEFAVRKWLVYITLFIAGAILAGDLITLIYYFLDGRELTAGFLLKVLSFLVVAGGIFGYYLDDLKGRLTGERRNYWRIFAVILVIASIILGFVVIGSPRTQRLLRHDQQKVSDLQNIQSQVVSFYQQKGTLPTSLDALKDSLSYYSIPNDPQTNMSYVYRINNSMSFELCANFNLDSKNYIGKSGYTGAYYYGDPNNENWAYKKGEYCFQRTIDPERYPLIPVPKPIR